MKKPRCPHGYILDNCIKCIHPPAKKPKVRGKADVRVKTYNEVGYDLRVYFDEGYAVIEEIMSEGTMYERRNEVYIPLSHLTDVLKALEKVATFGGW